MKPLRINKVKPGKVLGLAIGERSLLAAEIVPGDRPSARLLCEMAYPDGVTLQNPAALGEALGAFLRDKKFTAKTAVIGLPARWLLVKGKDVPPADTATLNNILRLQAEGEFSSELKDLVYDYTADTSVGSPKSVLLIATSRRNLDGIEQMCDAAKISPVMITASAIALGVATTRSSPSKNPLVLLVSPSGAEITAQSGETSNAIRHMRPPTPDKPFVGELRRTISGLPQGAGSNGTPRELVLWDGGGGYNFTALHESLGMPVRTGDLPILGVDTTDAASNGEGRKYAAAVALGMLALSDERAPVDFLHSRLAAPKPPAIPQWALITGISVITVLLAVIWGYSYQSSMQAKLDQKKADIAKIADRVKQDRAFVNKVSIARAWHLGQPRYLACLRDLTNAVPVDGQTYAVALTIEEITPPTNNSSAPGTNAVQTFAVKDLSGRLEGKTTEQRRVLQLMADMKSNPAFSEVKLNGTNDAGRTHEISFTITFNYAPAKAVK